MNRLLSSQPPAMPVRVRAWSGVAGVEIGRRDALSPSRGIVVLRDVVPH